MAMRSTRFIGDDVLNGCQSGQWVLSADDDDLAVMRVQEALTVLGYNPGKLDGVFGTNTGNAVKAFKRAQGLSPADAVVGPGTSTALDNAMYHNPPYLDPWFGEVAPWVLNQVVEPFVGFELNYLITRPLNTIRHDVGFAMLSLLRDEICLAMVSQNRTAGIPDLRVDEDSRASVANLTGSAIYVPFTGPDAITRGIIGFRDTTIMGRRFHTNKQGKKAKVTLRSALIHELTHMRNVDSGALQVTEDDGSVFLDPNVAVALSASGDMTREVYVHFIQEVVASHVEWVGQQEEAGNPFAARFLDPAALTEAVHYYFTSVDSGWFRDNGYMAACVAAGDLGIYRQAALWLRAASSLVFADNSELDAISTRLFQDAADEAERLANNPGAQHVPPDGVATLPRDYS
ncbi:peptidoglycan-binding domain-containing protein [Candidatus Mycobacterium wuenschmannii]|uniref:Peptidoglycan-binding domain-containing protein n=1 Tax=Candidatus Mycobacterium wuenschmannii TaxID=3027808 RepID=A0ABY8VYA6_9MYCO|nr:peptidoglycan-binding domain-containing protein [Candidatus Mycobacterium wuenschmannii]WIM87128.1 peptidoglycan-binding domain-containing protein [Candidatus Mycobacterium wuenschmannii]